MIITYTLEKGQKLTEAQLKELEEASKHPIVFDEDCPELSEEMLEAFRCAARERNRRLMEKYGKLPEF